jgi:predicted nucleotidyltransferase
VVTPSETARALLERFTRASAAVRARQPRVRDQLSQHVPAAASAAGATRVYLFGSFAWGQPHGSSDVDLGVEGLSRSACDDLAARLLFLIDARLDVVALDQAAPGLRERILREGTLLWARKGEERAP